VDEVGGLEAAGGECSRFGTVEIPLGAGSKYNDIKWTRDVAIVPR